MNPRRMLVPMVFAASLFTCVSFVGAQTANRSGVYLTAADYANGRLSFEGDCGAKAHKLEIHDVWNKPYIDVRHNSEKQRYSKSDLFGFRACDGTRLSIWFQPRVPNSRSKGTLYLFPRHHGKRRSKQPNGP